MPRHIVCLTFDFDTQSGFIARGMTSPTPLSRGEFGAMASRRILDLLVSRGNDRFFACRKRSKRQRAVQFPRPVPDYAGVEQTHADLTVPGVEAIANKRQKEKVPAGRDYPHGPKINFC